MTSIFWAQHVQAVCCSSYSKIAFPLPLIAALDRLGKEVADKGDQIGRSFRVSVFNLYRWLAGSCAEASFVADAYH